jgi:hypothetical protein
MSTFLLYSHLQTTADDVETLNINVHGFRDCLKSATPILIGDYNILTNFFDLAVRTGRKITGRRPMISFLIP